jgi:hypothetical protein
VLATSDGWHVAELVSIGRPRMVRHGKEAFSMSAGRPLAALAGGFSLACVRS